MEKIILLVKKIYLHIPISFLNFIAPFYHMLPVSLRYGKTYSRTKKYIEDNMNLTEMSYKELVDKNFVRLIEYCYNYVPYYRRIMDERNISPKDFHSYEDIEKLPILTKETLNEEGDNMLSTQFKKQSLVKKQTSGSTGIPQTIYLESATEMVEWAYIMHLWNRVGYNENSSRLVLRAKAFRAEKRRKKYQWDAARKELSIGIRDIREDDSEIYCRVIEKYKPEFIYGYPSAIFQLCQIIEKHELKHQFKAALFVSENITEPVRNYVEKILKCKSYSFYGHTERALIAGEVPEKKCYYIEPTYGYAEILDKNMKPIGLGERGEIIVTGFLNYAMPLIRYATGDIASWEEENSKIHRYIKSIDGRTLDYLVAFDGNIINVNAFRYSQYGKFCVKSFQFVQYVQGAVVLKVIPDIGWTEEKKKELYDFVCDEIDGRLELSIEECESMIIEKNGKQRVVVSRMDLAR